MDTDLAEHRTRRIAGKILIFLPGFALIMSAILKFAHVPGVVSQMAASGFTDGKLTLVATLEILSGGLFLSSRTRSFGLLMASAFLGGAICTHIQMGEFAKAVPPSILLALAWVGTWLRHPQVLWSSNSSRSLAAQRTERLAASKSA